MKMVADRDQFLKALAAFMATAAELVYGEATSTAKVDLWIYQAVEPLANDTYSVLVPYDGKHPWTPAAELSIQCKTVAKKRALAMARSQALLETLVDDQGRPMQRVTIGEDSLQFKITGVRNVRGPSIVADDRDRAVVVINFDVQFVQIPA